MASAYVEYGTTTLPAPAGFQSGAGSSVTGRCAASEVLAISGSQATGATTATSTTPVARISTDTACYVAVGLVPNCAAVVATADTGARRFLGANTSELFALRVGDLVAVKAVS